MNELQSKLEAVLFASGDSVPISRLSLSFSVPEDEIVSSARELAASYEQEQRGIRLLFLDDKLQLCSSPDFAADILRTLGQRKPPTLSQAALETLAVVAYFQPVTRAVIEKYRGVDSSYSVSQLEDRGLIEACGTLEVPGRPTLFRTTDAFLRVMNIASLEELPPLPEAQGNEREQALRDSIAKLRSSEEKDSRLQQSMFSGDEAADPEREERSEAQ